jgi:precorrin isomerase
LSHHLHERGDRIRSDSIDSQKSDISHHSFDEQHGCARVVHTTGKLESTKHRYKKEQEDFGREWRKKEEELTKEWEHKCKILADHRDVEDE